MKLNDMREMIDFLNYHTKLYDAGTPKISDAVWDSVYQELKATEDALRIYYPDSPTQVIVYELQSELEKVTHSSPMLSLDKVKLDTDAIKKFISKCDSVITAKMDGLTCRLTYKNGELVRAETRGDGYVGENITHNAKVVKSIPKKISYPNELVIDGEIICKEEDFKPFSNDYKNARNFAAGSIRLLNNKECEKRNLTFVAWNVVKGLENDHYSNDINTLYEYGFTVVPMLDTKEETVEENIDAIKDNCKMLGYPIDGCVFRFDSKDLYAAAGRTDHHPKGALAYKFGDETYTTFLKYIDWTMGRTGVLTPTAVFEAVDIDGTTVQRASLHNISVMEEFLGKQPYRHQKIEVYKANMINPQIAKSYWDEDYLYKEFFKIPDTCPICGESVQFITLNESTTLVCMNPTCEGKLVNRLDHFCGKKGLDIKGLSKATLERLIAWEWVQSITDIFELKRYREDWIEKDGFGVKSVDNILEAIKKSEICTLDKYIAALGIPLIGSVASKQLAKKFTTWENFYLAVQSGFKFYELPNFGSEMHDAITNFNYTEANLVACHYLLIQQTTTSSAEQKFTNMTFCITGKLKTYKNRTELKTYIEERGGKVTDSVSSKTNYLINNDKDSSSSKNKKAKELNIPILTEEEFNQM